MIFPDVTFSPGTSHEALLDKLQRFFVSARKYWLNLPENKTISSSSATGRKGQICYDTNYLYICVAANTWKRISLTW